MGNNKKKREIRKKQREREEKRKHSLFSKFSFLFTRYSIAMFVFLGAALYCFITSIKEHNLIKSNHSYTIGYVYDIRSSGRSTTVHYYFYVNGKRYTGRSSLNRHLEEGDIIISYTTKEIERKVLE